MNAIPWWGYVIIAGLSWGTYVPIVFYGGQMLTGDPKLAPLGGRLASILCVGAAYFVLAVVIPLVLMSSRGVSRRTSSVKQHKQGHVSGCPSASPYLTSSGQSRGRVRASSKPLPGRMPPAEVQSDRAVL